MPASRRLWESSVVIGYLAGYAELESECSQIIEQAKSGEIEILVSVIATVETAYLRGESDAASEALIQEFFGRNYVIPVGIDPRTALISRGLIRKYRTGPKLKPPDAAQLGTAIQWHVPIIETTDPDLLRLDDLEGNPLIRIRHPLYEGQTRFI